LLRTASVMVAFLALASPLLRSMKAFHLAAVVI
jgi:hypothetical protein